MDRPFDSFHTCGDGGKTPNPAPDLRLQSGTLVHLYFESWRRLRTPILHAEVLEDHGETLDVRVRHPVFDAETGRLILEDDSVLLDLPKQKVWMATSSEWPAVQIRTER